MSRLMKSSAPYALENDQYLQFRKGDRYTKSIYDVNVNTGTNPDSKISRILVVDSADRNFDKYPNPSKYTVKLKKPHKDVISVELKAADIPNSGYIITEYNNKFYWQDTTEQIADQTCHVVRIPVGNYSISEILENLQEEINDFNTGSQYTVTLNSNTNKVTITQTDGSGVFNILSAGDPEVYGSEHGTITDPLGNVHDINKETRSTYREDAVAPVIGFSRSDLSGETSYTGAYAYNLKTDKYIVLKIRGLDRVESINSFADGSFCVISLDSSVNNFQYAKNSDQIDNDAYVKYFSQPIPEINEMDIEFINSNGKSYDFNGHDHLLTFEITSLSQNDMFSGRK